MKLPLLIAALWVALPIAETLAQPATRRPGTTPPDSSQSGAQRTAELTLFDLDFPGGSPRELVSAIQKATGKPLNAIVPDEYADIKLPSLKMSNVNVQQLFAGLEQVSRKSQAVETGSYYGGGAYGSYKSMQVVQTSCGFRPGSGAITDDTIWCFYAEKPALPPIGGVGSGKICRFYSLKPYLDLQVATVDDITTAMETGWKMLGESAPPKISFHKDTKLLIAVGEPNKLEIIDAVLKALDSPKSSASNPTQPAPPTATTNAGPSKPSSGE